MRALLSHPRVYSLFGWLVGADRGRKTLVRDYVRPRKGDSVLDIGCGPADIIGYLPETRYVGFDASVQYIEHAKAVWGGRGEFTCGTVTETNVQHASFDIVLAIGVLHHLSDEEAHRLFQIAATALRPGGRLVTLDGAYVRGQSPLVRYILSKDRGEYVRATEAYEGLARTTFAAVKSSVLHTLMFPMPYTHLVMECSASVSATG